MKTTRRTGIIFPRDYGLTMKDKCTRQFVTPSAYAFGYAQLVEPSTVRNLVRIYAQNGNFDTDGVFVQWYKGLQKRFHSNTLENISGRQALAKVALYDESLFTAESISKSGDKLYAVSLATNAETFSCTCPSPHWGIPKKREVLCGHIALLAAALALDKKGIRNNDHNYTGLSLSKLEHAPSIPFSLSRDSIADMVVNYVALGKGFAEVNKGTLAREQNYTDATIELIRSQRAQFSVLRQRVKTKPRSSLVAYEDRFYDASEQLEIDIAEQLDAGGFTFEGYSFLFKGSDFEVVAKRFRQADIVYELARKEMQPPLLVRKTIGGFSRNWVSSNDARSDLPSKRAPYLSIDDATRRESHTEILIPAKNYPIAVPPLLREVYERL